MFIIVFDNFLINYVYLVFFFKIECILYFSCYLYIMLFFWLLRIWYVFIVCLYVLYMYSVYNFKENLRENVNIYLIDCCLIC